MADLRAIVDQPDAPPEIREAGRVLLATTPTISEITIAPDLRRAVERSGVLLETHLARAAAAAPLAGSAPLQVAEGDLKAALLIFRGALSAWLAKVEAPSNRDALNADVAPDTASSPHGADSVIRPPPARGGDAQPSLASTTPGETYANAGADERSSVDPKLAAIAGAPEEPDHATPQRAPGPLARASAQDSDPELAARFGAFVAPPARTSERTLAKLTLGKPTLPAVLQIEPLAAEGEPESPRAEPRALATRGYGGMVEERPKTPPPPYAGGPMAGQKPMEPKPQTPGAPESAVRRLLKSTLSALARQDLMQIASLPESVIHEQDASEPRTVQTKLNFDLPFVTAQGVAVAQFEISRDGGGASGGAPAALEQTYRARFSIDLEPLGPVHALVILSGARARVSLWAERSETIARLRAGEEALGAALREADLTPDVAVHSGAPPTPGGGPLGHFVDQAS